MTSPIVLAALAMVPNNATFVVAPNGLDTNPGTPARPFATVQRAWVAARAFRTGARAHAPVTVLIRGGTYSLTETLKLDEGARDAGGGSGSGPGPGRAWVTVRAFGSERPVITGGVPVTTFRKAAGRVFEADMSKTACAGKDVRVATCDGKRIEIARYPNRDATDPHGGKWAYVDGKRISMYADSPGPAEASDAARDFWQRNRPELTRSLRMRPDDARRVQAFDRLDRLVNPAAVAEVSVFPRFNWNHWVLPIVGLESDGRTLKLGEGSYYEIRPGDRYFVRGTRELLDVANEWLWDRAASVFAWIPPDPGRKSAVALACVDNLVEMDACSDVTLQGLTFECANGSGLVLRNCARVRIAGCVIRNVGDAVGDGVVIEGGHDNAVVGCDISATGNTGIRLGGGEHFTLTPGRNRAINNYIHHVGLVGKHANGVAVTGALHTVSHNLIHDVPHSAIFMWGSGHTIEFNRIRHTCLETEDAGAIGGGAIDWISWHGVIIRYNRIEDTMGYGYDESSRRWKSPYFAAALYPDWAASGVRIVGNILIRASRTCLMLHSGRDNVIENNIMVGDGVSVCQWQGWTTATGFWSSMAEGWVRNWEAVRGQPRWAGVASMKDPRTVPLADGHVMHGNVFRRNILVAEGTGTRVFRWEGLPFHRNVSDRNVVWAGGRPIRTGRIMAKAVQGPNLIENPGCEAGPVGGLPESWSWALGASDDATVAVVSGEAHSGVRSLAITHGSGDARTPGAVTMAAPGRAYPYVPGAAYVFEAWLRSDTERGDVRLEAYSWKAGAHSWVADTPIRVVPKWTLHRLVFRLPDRLTSEYRETMDTFQVRISVSPLKGTVWVDDVSLRKAVSTDEWSAWRALGLDRSSVVGDPGFVAASRGDYRLKANSPALMLGFVPLPFERMGPYKSADRATWPIIEARGAREMVRERPKGAVRKQR